MKLDTYMKVRNAYYAGIGILILYSFAGSRVFLTNILDKEIFSGIPLISIVGGLTALGAIQAYNRKLG